MYPYVYLRRLIIELPRSDDDFLRRQGDEGADCWAAAIVLVES